MVSRLAPARAISCSSTRRTVDQAVEQRHVVVVLQSDPDHDRVEEVPRASWLNRRSPPLLDAHQPALLEQLHTLANDGAAEPELLAERGLGRQDLTLHERAADDLLREFFDDDGREAPRPPRWSTVTCDMKRRAEGRAILALAHRDIICSRAADRLNGEPSLGNRTACRRASPLDARRATRDQTFDLSARGHGGVAGRRHGKCAVRDAVGESLIGRRSLEEPKDQARCERVAASDPVEDLEAVETRADVETRLGHADCRSSR